MLEDNALLLVWNLDTGTSGAPCQELLRNGFIMGQSGFAPDISMLPQLMNQARQAMTGARKEGRQAVSGEDFVTERIQQAFYENEAVQALVHPAVPRLFRETDEKNLSYGEMLRAYLQCGGNRSLAAKRLNIHRNTLLYHLNRMQDMFGFSLDDPKEREALRLSLLIAKP